MDSTGAITMYGSAAGNVISILKAENCTTTDIAFHPEIEVELAELVVAAMPSVEKVRFVSSGTEATMSAIRLARGYTEKTKVVKFDGGYHGHADSFLVKAGSGVITLGIPGSPGVPEDIVKNTIYIPFNNIRGLKKTQRDESLDIACVIAEPVPANMGVLLPADGYLKQLRALTEEPTFSLVRHSEDDARGDHADRTDPTNGATEGR